MTDNSSTPLEAEQDAEVAATSAAEALTDPPVAEQRAHSFTHHGVTIEDPWHWLRDPGYPTVSDSDVLEYLEDENRYFEAAMAQHQGLIDTIFEEIKGRQQPDLSSVPWKRGSWFYQWSFQEGSQYREWKRWPVGTPDAREGPPGDAETLLDESAMADGLEYFRLGSMSVSNDGSLLSYSSDTDGSERFAMEVKDLATGEVRDERIAGTTGRSRVGGGRCLLSLHAGGRELAPVAGAPPHSRPDC